VQNSSLKREFAAQVALHRRLFPDGATPQAEMSLLWHASPASSVSTKPHANQEIGVPRTELLAWWK